MPVVIMGIDPGLRGAIAVMDEEESVVVEDMPVVSVPKQGRKDRKQVDHDALFDLLRVIKHPAYCVVEEQHAMPFQGLVSTMSIGYGYGAILQCLADVGIKRETVRASVWQKVYGIAGKKGDTKDQAAHICKQLFPGADLLATPRSRKPHDGRVDAILICEYARRKHQGALLDR